MAKSGVEHLAQHPAWKSKKRRKNPTKHGVYIQYGETKLKLTADDLQLIADALEIVNPGAPEDEANARKLSASFGALAEYAQSVEKKR